MQEIVVATKNKNKVGEIERITSAFNIKAVSRDEAGLPDVEIEETGESFAENSLIKARAIYDLCGKATIADDSGLEVDCLDGAPGVYSSRFAGAEANDRDNNDKLLSMMKDVPEEERTARFVCVITMITESGDILEARGTVEGHIAFAERGENGFGYDPLFVPDGYEGTFAELGAEVKNRISHRARALKDLAAQLERRSADVF